MPVAQAGAAERDGAADPLVSETALDWAFFVFGGVAAVWFALQLLDESLDWRRVWFLVVFWAALAYLVLPRLHRILTRIYIPDYFMGRTRTSDGLFGDPVNLSLLGETGQVREAMVRAGWTEADPVSLASSWRIVVSTVLRRSYDAAPVSPLLLFNRQQDFAYQQEVDGTPGRRHHVRFWKCPPGWLLPGGISVDWLAAASYDRAVGLSYFTLQVTHRISPDVDRERDHVLETVTRGSPAASVRVIKDFSTGYHSRNGGGDSIRTDGNLPVVDLSALLLPPGNSTDTVPDSRDRVPAPTVVGSALVLLRMLAALAASGLILAGSAEQTWVGDLMGQDQALLNAAGTYVPVGSALVLFAAVEAALAVFILRGRNWARLTAMSFSTVSILLQGASFLAAGSHAFQTDRPAFALDVLILLALSSDRSRTFAHRRHRYRRVTGRSAGGH